MTLMTNQHRSNRLTSAPAVEPITATELRTHLVASSTDLPDAEADDFIEEARQFIEDMTGVAMITQTWRMALDHWPNVADVWWDGVKQGSRLTLETPVRGDVEIPRYPMQSISSINTYDRDDSATAVVVATVFVVDDYSMPGRLTLRAGQSWPTALRTTNAIEITYISGYGDAATDVPATLKRAVKLLAAKMYSERGDGCSVENAYSMSGAEAIVDAYKVMRV